MRQREVSSPGGQSRSQRTTWIWGMWWAPAAKRCKQIQTQPESDPSRFPPFLDLSTAVGEACQLSRGCEAIDSWAAFPTYYHHSLHQRQSQENLWEVLPCPYMFGQKTCLPLVPNMLVALCCTHTRNSSGMSLVSHTASRSLRVAAPEEIELRAIGICLDFAATVFAPRRVQPRREALSSG
jgi:hypothetical protein